MERVNIVFCSFENRFAKSGGLATVTMRILPYLRETDRRPSERREVFLITPFYPAIMGSAELKSAGIRFQVLFAKDTVETDIYEYTWNYERPGTGCIREYYLKAKGYFGAVNTINDRASIDPYIYFEGDRSKNDELLLMNSLFFCKAVPLALKELDIRENIVFHLQEWQTALISLTTKEAMCDGTLISGISVQTMHNPYDSFITWTSLEKIIDLERPLENGQTRRHALQNIHQDGLTAYQIGLALTDAPITTVSRNFADELTTDVIQTGHFAPHLQDTFKRKEVRGINNGMFVDFPSIFPKRGEHTIEGIKEIKRTQRNALVRILHKYKPGQRFGELTYKGGTILDLPESVPILVMSGRLDPSQKGFDILLQALERFPEDEIKAVLTPIAAREADLNYFYEIAGRCRGNITVFPLRMEEGYRELQAGSTYGLMPSIYEPFGAAIEYMVSGTVPIARATGGLIDQIDDKIGGFLFREPDDHYDLSHIKDFANVVDTVHRRRNNKWAQDMVEALYNVLVEAIALYRFRDKEYYRMILQGFRKAEMFNWEKSAGEYLNMMMQGTL